MEGSVICSMRICLHSDQSPCYSAPPHEDPAPTLSQCRYGGVQVMSSLSGAFLQAPAGLLAAFY